MPKPGEPEMRPDNAGVRVHLADLTEGDVIDWWVKRSGSFVLRENLLVTEIYEDGKVLLRTGDVLNRDAGWGELRLKERNGEAIHNRS